MTRHICCAAFDLDGTLLNPQSQVTRKTAQAITRLHQEGIHPIVASGRVFSTLPKSVRDLDGVEFAVTGNGSAIYRFVDGVCLHRNAIAHDAVERVLQVTRDAPVSYEFYIDGIAYADAAYVKTPECFGFDQQTCQYVRSTRTPVADLKRFLEENNGRIDSMALSLYDLSEKEAIWQQLHRDVPGIFITSAVPRLIEIADQQAGKENGLSYVLHHLGLDPSQLVAFGDAHNDLGMIRYAGIGVAMGNADTILKEAADFVTRSNAEDGVAYGLCRLLSWQRCED